jgi:hypothetical protein
MMTNFPLNRSQKTTTTPVIKRVLVRCPATGKLSPTGQTINEALWAKAKFKPARSTCPHCGEKHSWKKADAVLAR